MNIRLLLIDAQVDFCEPGDADKGIPTGALYVNGAENDCIRTAAMIKRLGKKISKIYATFDSHRQYQIFHGMFWKTNEGPGINPFTQIEHADVVNGDIVPMDPKLLDWCLEYTKQLEESGKYPLVIWPYHCLIGTPGWNLNPEIMEAILDWEKATYRMFEPITKGTNFKTEHYSAVKAEVLDPNDAATGIKHTGIVESLEVADMVAIAGQARSHCVANTVRDIMEGFSDPSYIKKLYILEDATSDVAGFENLGEAFIKDFKEAGGNITTTDKFLA